MKIDSYYFFLSSIHASHQVSCMGLFFLLLGVQRHYTFTDQFCQLSYHTDNQIPSTPTFVVLVHFVMLNIVVSNSVSANRIWRLLCLELRILNNSRSEILLFSLTTFCLITEGDMSSRPILIRSSRAV